MSYQTKRKIMNSTVYIVLGLVIAAVITVTVATVVSMRGRNTPPEVEGEPSQTQAGEIFTKEEQPTPEPTASETPAVNTLTGKEETDKQAIVPVNQDCFMPAEGTLLKEYSDSLPVKSLTMNDYRVHNGIDISAPAGSAVAAMADGKILSIWSDPMMGMCLSIDHGDGLVSFYKNLDPVFPSGIEKGADVKAGQTVAAVGNTCLIELADTDHLHFEITLNGKHVNPAGYLEMNAMPKTDAGDE